MLRRRAGAVRRSLFEIFFKSLLLLSPKHAQAHPCVAPNWPSMAN